MTLNISPDSVIMVPTAYVSKELGYDCGTYSKIAENSSVCNSERFDDASEQDQGHHHTPINYCR